MAGLALGMAGSVAVTGLFTPAWPMAAIGLVVGILSATAMSWHGILLSETARLAPAGRAGAVTGGPIVWSDRRVPGPLCVLAVALPDWRLRRRLGRVRHSGFVGRYQSVRPGAGRTRRSPVSEVGSG
jgi:hypothetical protein